MRIPALDLVKKTKQHFVQRLESYPIQGEDVTLADQALVGFELQQYATNAAHLMNGSGDGPLERYLDQPGFTARNLQISSGKKGRRGRNDA